MTTGAARLFAVDHVPTVTEITGHIHITTTSTMPHIHTRLTALCPGLPG